MSPFLLLLVGASHARDEDDDDAPRASAPAARFDFAEMSVTPGGAQDVGHFRERVAAGEVPHPAVFTPEGLLGEHDLPLDGATRCTALLCPIGEAVPATLIAQPEVRWLAQLGFDTSVDATTWRRDPVNLVAVVDKSGSMSGTPIESVRAALIAVAGQLGPSDQLSIVLYGDSVHTHLAPTPAGAREQIRRAIDAIQISGSTNMEAGLVHGFDLARETARSFGGTTRVMLFTDERPNVGRTDAGSFMTLARAGSRQGVGMTTIGVGQQFGAELAAQISSVRGGNLFTFPDRETMEQVFRDEFDTMVTEVAYDMTLHLVPADGLSVTGVYGVPGDAVRWEGPALVMDVETLFLSRDEGAIFFSFGPSGPVPMRGAPKSVGSVSLRYALRSGAVEERAIDLGVVATPQVGLARGAMLVDEVTAFKKATALHHEQNDQEGAWRLVHELSGRWAGTADPELARELELIASLESTLALLSGHRGEGPVGTLGRSGLSGLPATVRGR